MTTAPAAQKKPAAPAAPPAAPPPTPRAPPPPTWTPAPPAAAFQPVPAKPTDEVVTLRPTEPAAPQTPPPRPPNRPLQVLLESLAILIFLALTAIPLTRFGILTVGPELETNLLILSSFLLAGLVTLFPLVRYRPKVGDIEAQLTKAARRDLWLNVLSIAGTILQALILVVEIVALLVYLRYIRSTSEAVVAAADNFVLFATFSLLLLCMLLIARTSFEPKYKGRSWHLRASHILFLVSLILLLLSLLKNAGGLDVSVFRGLKPEQSSYILVLAVFLQIFGTKMALRYPPVSRIIVGELEAARKANKEYRDVLKRKALTAYFLGLLFVLVSIFFLGGVATGNVATGNERSTNFLLIAYLTFGAIIIGLLFTRYIQQRFIAQREKRREQGEVIGKRRLSREEINRIVLFSFSGFFAFLFLVAGALTFLGMTPLKTKYGTDLLILAFLTGIGPYGFHRTMRMRRIRAMDDKFPDFLRDLAEGQRAGMTLPKALLSASKGVYGALTPEIKHMSAQVEWGVSFTEALQRFAQRVRTPLIQRTVALIVEASKAGGNVVDILTAASTDARDIKQILEERHRQMGIYSVIIYVAFMVFLVVIYILAAQFLPSFHKAIQGASGQQVGGFSFAPFSIDTYVSIFFHAALIQGIGGGLVAGVMTEGHPLGGLKHAVIMTIISWVFFRVLLG